MKNNITKISVYDFDKTLSLDNSLHGFVDYFILNQRNNNPILNFINYAIYKSKLFYLDRIIKKSKIEFLLIQLLGHSKMEICALAKEFVRCKLKFNHKLVDEMELDRLSGMTPVIVSGSIEEIIGPAAEVLNIQIYKSSTLNYSNSQCLGDLKESLIGKKDCAVDELLTQYINVNLENSKFTSDNVEDINCAVRFGKVVGIIWNKKADTLWSKVTNIKIKIKPGVKLNALHTYVLGYYYFLIRSNWYTTLLFRLGFLAFVSLTLEIPNSADLIILSWIVFISLYEIGYIDNDYYAVKKEDNPSIRLSADQKENQVRKFIIARIFYAFIGALLLTINFDMAAALIIIGAAVANLVIYLIHNRLPRGSRLLSYALLKASHLYIPLIAVAPIGSIFLAIFIFYLPSTLIEYSEKIGVKIKKNWREQPILLLVQWIILVVLFLWLDDALSEVVKYGFYLLTIGSIPVLVKCQRYLRKYN
jgi:phosphoserine phosphatase